MTYRMCENETDIYIVLMIKEHHRFIQNMMTILWEFQHSLVVADIDKTKIRNVVRKTCAVRRKIGLLKGFEEKVMKLVDIGVPNLWGHFKDGVLRACNDMCGKKRRSNGDTWW